MIKIPHQQILDRYDTLPESLKDAGFSSYNTLLIEKIGETNHLAPDKISTISQLVGRVLFGFIHSEDLAKEIQESLNLNPEIANSISEEIDRKIFNPVRADLEKVYAPSVEEEVLDLRLAAKEMKPVEEAVLPTVEAPMPEMEAPVLSPVEAPKILPQEEKPEAVKPPEISPMAAPLAPVLPAAEAGPVATSEAEPFIIHKEAEFKPLFETKKSLGGLFGFLRKSGEEKLQKAEPARAEVEIGDKSLKAEPSKITKTEPPKVRVVHYTEFQPAVSPFPVEGEKIRAEIKEEKKAEEKIEIKPPENLPVVSEVEPPVVSRAEPPTEKPSGTISQGQAFQPPKIEIPTPWGRDPDYNVGIEKKPIAEEVPAPKTEPVLDLRKAAEPIRPAPEKPISPTPAPVSPAKPEAKGPVKGDEEMINLGMFK